MNLNKLILILFIFLSIINIGLIQACDSTPSIIVNTNNNNGDGTYTLDLSICIGSGGSADGFDLYFENGSIMPRPIEPLLLEKSFLKPKLNIEKLGLSP